MFRTLITGWVSAALLFGVATPGLALPRASEPLDDDVRASGVCAAAMFREARANGGEAWSFRGTWAYRYFANEILIPHGRYEEGRVPLLKLALAEAAKAKTTEEDLDRCHGRLPAEGAGRGLLSGDRIIDNGACQFVAGLLESSVPMFPSEASLGQHYKAFGRKLIDDLKKARHPISRWEQRRVEQRIGIMLRAAPDVEIADQCMARFGDAP